MFDFSNIKFRNGERQPELRGSATELRAVGKQQNSLKRKNDGMSVVLAFPQGIEPRTSP